MNFHGNLTECLGSLVMTQNYIQGKKQIHSSLMLAIQIKDIKQWQEDMNFKFESHEVSFFLFWHFRVLSERFYVGFAIFPFVNKQRHFRNT